jgi:hypothetical protein
MKREGRERDKLILKKIKKKQEKRGIGCELGKENGRGNKGWLQVVTVEGNE